MVSAPRSKTKKAGRKTMDIRAFLSDSSRSTSPQLPGNLPAAAMAPQPQPPTTSAAEATTPGAGPGPAGGPTIVLPSTAAGALIVPTAMVDSIQKEEPCKELLAQAAASSSGSVPAMGAVVDAPLAVPPPAPAGGPEAMDVVGATPGGEMVGMNGGEDHGDAAPPALPPPAPVGVMPDHLEIDLPPLVMRPDAQAIPAPGMDAPPAPLAPPPPQCPVGMPPMGDGTMPPVHPVVPGVDMKMPTEEQLRKLAAQLPPGPDGQPGRLNERHGLPSNLSKEIREMLLSGGPTPHMVTVGPTGKDEIVLGGTDRRTQGRAYQTKKRIERLESLSRCPRSDLNAHEKEAKLRLLKLESNRRAAQVSRQKKKRYIANLEERAAMMAKHLAALDIENGQLRALLAEVAAKVIPGGNLTNGITLPGGGVLEFPMPAPQLPLPPLAFAPKTEPSTPSARGRGSTGKGDAETSSSGFSSGANSLRNSQKRTLNEMFAS